MTRNDFELLITFTMPLPNEMTPGGQSLQWTNLIPTDWGNIFAFNARVGSRGLRRGRVGVGRVAARGGRARIPRYFTL